MPRLGYTKSRTGCLKCRQRRIKCDEKRPCTACKKHSVACSLLSSSAAGSERGSRFQLPLQPDPVSNEAHGHASEPCSPQFSQTPTPSATGSATASLNPESGMPAQSSEFSVWKDPDDQKLSWAVDLELTHHYATRAYLTLPRANEIGRVWCTDAFEMALSHEFLLHQILAFSALHLAYLRPDRRDQYSLAAAHHRTRGLKDMRDSLADITTDNCHALFMASSMLMIASFGDLATRADARDAHGPTLQDVIEIFMLTKGMSAVLNMWQDVIQQGRFSNLFLLSDSVGSHQFCRDALQQLQRLRRELSMRVNDPVINPVLDKEVMSLVRELESAMLSAPVPEVRAMMTWPISTSDAFIQLLRGRSPPALVVITYYCVVVHQTEEEVWYTRGWGSRLIRQAEAELLPMWSDLIQWPLERILSARGSQGA